MFNFVVIPDKLIFANAPGCGTKTVLGWITCIQKPDIYTNHPEFFTEYKKVPGVEYKELHELIATKKDYQVDNMVTSWFCIVKDPVQRFIDNYRARVLYQQKTSQQILSISDFIERFDEILKNDTKGLKWWFNPLSSNENLQNMANTYERVFNINQMDQVKYYLEEKSGKTLPNLHLNRIPDSIETPTLTQTQIDWIKFKYTNDYKNYGKYF